MRKIKKIHNHFEEERLTLFEAINAFQNGDEDKQQGGQRPKGGMSPEQQEALLQAVQAEEDKTQDKLKEKKGVLLIHGGKNW
jgi:hypothetical protein